MCNTAEFIDPLPSKYQTSVANINIDIDTFYIEKWYVKLN